MINHSPGSRIPVLSTNNICKKFDQLPASVNVSLDLYHGEIHALIGPNGAGKSTLIKQIAGSLQPDSGQIWFKGQNVTALATPARARLGLARTFQVSALALEDTVLQNVMLGCLGAHGATFNMFKPVMQVRHIRVDAQTALQRVGLAANANQRAAELSHGQRRQLEIAIALTLKPSAFVMDEPMAGLGTQGSSMLVKFLETLKHEAPILMVEHDMDAVFALADRVSVLVYGEIIASGTVDQIRNNTDVIRAYLGEEA